MTINKKKIYTEIVSKIEEALQKDDFESLDYILEYITTNTDEEIGEFLSDLVDEATLYSEFKEDDYKDEALAIIEEDFGDIK